MDRQVFFQMYFGAGLTVLSDGAMGTMLQRRKLEEVAYRGERLADWHQDVKGNNDLLVLTQPDIIRGIHDAYCAAGADLLISVHANAFVRTSLTGVETFFHAVTASNAEARRVAEAENEADTRERPGRSSASTTPRTVGRTGRRVPSLREAT